MTSSRKPVEEFTTPDPVTTNKDTAVDELRRLVEEHGIRRG